MFGLMNKAYMFFGFNAVRILSIVALLLVFSSNILVMTQDIQAIRSGGYSTASSGSTSGNATSLAVMDEVDCDYLEDSTVPNQPAGAFWAIFNRLFIISQCVLLLLSELGWPEKFLDRYVPFLGPKYGVFFLGLMECMLGAAVLSHHVDEFPLVAAFFLFSIGCLNLILGVLFRAPLKVHRSLFRWMSNDVGELPRTQKGLERVVSRAGMNTNRSSLPANIGFLRGIFGRSDDEPEMEAVTPQDMSSWGFGRQGEKAAGLKGFLISKPMDSLPRYAPPPRSSEEGGSRSPERASSPPITRSLSPPMPYAHSTANRI